MKDELGCVGVHVPTGCDTGQDFGERQVPAHQALVADHSKDAVVVRAAAQAAPDGAAVDSDFFGLDDQRHGGDALGQRGQLAVAYHFCQQRRLFGLLRKRTASDAGQSGCAGKALEHRPAPGVGLPGLGGGFRCYRHRGLLIDISSALCQTTFALSSKVKP